MTNQGLTPARLTFEGHVDHLGTFVIATGATFYPTLTEHGVIVRLADTEETPAPLPISTDDIRDGDEIVIRGVARRVLGGLAIEAGPGSIIGHTPKPRRLGMNDRVDTPRPDGVPGVIRYVEDGVAVVRHDDGVIWNYALSDLRRRVG